MIPVRPIFPSAMDFPVNTPIAKTLLLITSHAILQRTFQNTTGLRTGSNPLGSRAKARFNIWNEPFPCAK